MPFTLSHAAAVLPAVRADGTGRGPLVPAVLVAGSFAPDMPYFAASVVSGTMEFGSVTHSFTGVFTVDVLIAWTLVGLWLLVREPLVALLPRSRQGRPAALLHCGAPRTRVRPSSVAWWYVSAALGALTHVVWDAFTHLDRWGMRLLPVLGRELAGSPCTGTSSTAVPPSPPSSSSCSWCTRCGRHRRPPSRPASRSCRPGTGTGPVPWSAAARYWERYSG